MGGEGACFPSDATQVLACLHTQYHQLQVFSGSRSLKIPSVVVVAGVLNRLVVVFTFLVVVGIFFVQVVVSGLSVVQVVVSGL